MKDRTATDAGTPVAWLGADMTKKNTQIIAAYGALGLLAVGIISYDHVSRMDGPVPDLVLPAQVRVHASAAEPVTTVSEAPDEGEQSAEDTTTEPSGALAAHQ
ncbi:MAG TPA: hypothetical protein VEX38_05400 [Fimbriimonadaceae bacterium]|nr:hypothetical protein [Fimbriimonadaceae bacterium]